jgi:hypothetical protein
MEVQIAFGKNAPVLDEVKLLATQRVKRMGNPNAATSFCHSWCNREAIQGGGQRKGYIR